MHRCRASMRANGRTVDVFCCINSWIALDYDSSLCYSFRVCENQTVAMKTSLVLASIAASASAFVPAQQGASVSKTAATKADLEAIAEKANPVVKFYDPMNLAEADFWGKGNEATIGFLRQSEIKVSGSHPTRYASCVVVSIADNL